MEVIVTSGGTKQVPGQTRLYVRRAGETEPWGGDEVCDDMEVVFEMTSAGGGSGTVERQDEPDIAADLWTPLGVLPVETFQDPPGTFWKRYIYPWPTTADPNWQVNFRGKHWRLPGPPPWYYTGPNEYHVNNTVVHSPNDVLLFNGTDSVDVNFTLGHMALDGLTFTVDVTIMTPDHTEVRTIHQAGLPLATTSVQWDGKDDQGMTVAPGPYIYRVQATHTGIEACTDADKAKQLAPQVTGLHFTGAGSDTLSGHVEYTLNRAAASCFARIYGRAPGGSLQQLGGDVACPSVTQGAHTSDLFTVTALRDPNGHLAGTYWAVIFATETVSDAEAGNRDREQKYALQHGVSRDSPIRIQVVGDAPVAVPNDHLDVRPRILGGPN